MQKIDNLTFLGKIKKIMEKKNRIINKKQEISHY